MPSSSESASAAAAAMAVLATLACSGPTVEVLRGPSSGFVERGGGEFYRDGEPYMFLGLNAFRLTGCTPTLGGLTDGELDAFFASLRPRSMVRTYALEPLGLEAIQRVAASARRHGHTLALVLTDHLSSCGEGEIPKDLAWYQSGFRDTYLPWVRTVVSALGNDPAVAFWEPVKGPLDVDSSTLRTFYDVVGGEIHYLAPDQLVQAGTHAAWAYGGDAGYQLIVESTGIDVATFHDYDNAAAGFVGLEASLQTAAALSKPLVLVEAGMFASRDGDPAQSEGGMTCISWDARRDLIARRLPTGYAAGLDGVFVWTWAPAYQAGCGYNVVPEDPTFELVREY